MKKFTCFYMLIGILLPCSVFAQGISPVKEFNRLDLFYVDNSKTGKSPALNDSLLERLFIEMNKVKKNTDSKFLLFLSDDDKFKKEENVNNATSISFKMDVAEKNTRLPNLDEDKERLRDLLYDQTFKINSVFYFHYFLSPVTIQSMMEEGKTMPVYLAKELMAAFGNETKAGAMIYIYYNKDDKSFSETELMDQLSFYNTKQFKSNITCKLIGL